MNEQERNLAREMDELKAEISEIKGLLATSIGENVRRVIGEQTGQEEPAGEKAGRIYKMKGMHPDKNIQSILDRLENDCGVTGDSGRISYVGVFSAGDRQSNWVRHNVNTDVLLELVESGRAAPVLSSVGNSDRLKLLVTLLKQPMTVAELLEREEFTSTGQIYHHLKALQAADLITEEKGRYAVRYHRVQGIIMLLAGVSDVLDESYTRGAWQTE